MDAGSLAQEPDAQRSSTHGLSSGLQVVVVAAA